MFRFFVRLSVVTALMLSLSPILSTPVAAQGEHASDAKHRIDLAGRQRMLSQRMTQAACFLHLGANNTYNLDMLKAAHDLFAATHMALQYGNADLGLEREQDVTVLIAMGDVDELWTAFRFALNPILDGGPVERDTLVSLNEMGLELLSTMNETVDVIGFSHSAGLVELSPVVARTVDLAGRQRMFTQKIIKEYCLADAGINADENLASLDDSRTYFNTTLDALIHGLSGAVMAAPNDEIRAKLLEVQSLWAGPNAVFAAATAGEVIAGGDLRAIELDVEAALVAMNQAVGMYEHAVTSQ